MLVLDYPRTMGADDNWLLVPPFHSGHLGFRPNTEVTLELLTESRSRTAYCELVVSPFSRPSVGTVALAAVMRDEVGAVERLVGAISELGLSINVEESASIAHLQRHSVSLILGLEALGAPPTRPSEPIARVLYRDYAAYVPMHDSRCRLIFETVIRHCADILAVRPGGLRPTLDLSIRLLVGHPRGRTGTAKLVAAADRNVRLPLPVQILRAVRSAPRPTSEADLRYLFFSDTEDRSLRVFFLSARAAKSIYHVALHHRDQSHALGVLLSLTTAAKFNILTSLVRSGEKAGENVWEAVLEYRGDGEQPDRAPGGQPDPDWFRTYALPWLRDRLVNVISDPSRVAPFDIELSQPTYPRPGVAIERLPLSGQRNGVGMFSAPAVDHEIQIERRRAQIATLPTADREIRLAILDQVVVRREWPRIFLAYTPSSRRHAELVRGSLGEHYEIVKREASDCDHQEASREVASCDFFIGLWHHNKHLVQGRDAFGGSPWIHFQYGLAVAAGKPTLIVRSTDADPTSWPDSLAGPHHIEYTDLDFATLTLGDIQQFCADHFRLDVD